jgi:hypothetical protein
MGKLRDAEENLHPLRGRESDLHLTLQSVRKFRTWNVFTATDSSTGSSGQVLESRGLVVGSTRRFVEVHWP